MPIISKKTPLLLALSFLLIAGPGQVRSSTPDGLTPAEENACDGLGGAQWGLCNAYCEAMDCDSVEPHASEDACARILDNYRSHASWSDPPCLASAEPQGDTDSDGVLDSEDVCPIHSDPDQFDSDGDGVGDACDNCPLMPNSDQLDTDHDAIGDACDNCETDSNANQFDGDADGWGDVCDNCPDDSNPDQTDSDADGTGDICADICALEGERCEVDADCCTGGCEFTCISF